MKVSRGIIYEYTRYVYAGAEIPLRNGRKPIILQDDKIIDWLLGE